MLNKKINKQTNLKLLTFKTDQEAEQLIKH